MHKFVVTLLSKFLPVVEFKDIEYSEIDYGNIDIQVEGKSQFHNMLQY